MAALGHKTNADMLAHWKGDSANRTDTKLILNNLGSLGTTFRATAVSEAAAASARPVGPVVDGFRKFARQFTPGTTSLVSGTANTTLEGALKSTYTAEAFVRVNSLAATMHICAYTALGETSATNTLIQWSINTSGRMVVFTESGAGVNQTITQSTGAQMVADTWYYVAITQDATNVNFYINGNLEQAVAKGTLATGGTTGTLYIGTNQDLANETTPMNGFMGAFKITAGAKSGGDITTAYGEFTADFELSTGSALVHYNMTDLADTIYDSLDKIHVWPTTTASLLHRSGTLIDDDSDGIFNNGTGTFSYAANATTVGADGANVEALRQAFLATTGWTFSGWFKVSAQGVTNRINGLFCFGDPGLNTAVGNFLAFEITASGAFTFWSEYGTDSDSTHTTTYTLGDLHYKRNHIACVRYPTVAGKHPVGVFVNGALVEMIANVEPYTGGSTQSLRLLNGANEQPLIGTADDMCFYDSPVTDAEILENYQRGVRLVPPVISGVTAAGAVTNASALAATITHASEQLDRIQVWMERDDGVDEMIHDGLTSGFKAGYSASSTNGASGTGRVLSITRTGGFDTEAFTLKIRAVDIHGNVATSSTDYTVSDFTEDPVDTGAPIITNFVPANGSEIRDLQSLQFDITDDLGFAVVALFTSWEDPDTGDDVVDFVHDGDAFRGNYTDTTVNTRTAISGGWRYTIRRAGGWPKNSDGTNLPLSIEFLPVDTSGNIGEIT